MFSVGAIHDLPRDAQSACSQVAVEEGILEFIKFGNGQTTPMTIPAVDPLLPPVHAPVTTTKGTTTLQNFFDSLPKPFPERLELNKTATELNGPGLLNGILQMGKGSKLTSQFYPITEEFGKSRREYLFVYVYEKKDVFLIGNSSLWVCSSRGQPR